MSDQPIISVSGLRGIIGKTLTPSVVSKYACALADELDDGPIVISRDGRTTGRMLADAIRASLQAVGRTVIDADVAATPTTGILIRHVKAAGGIQISASHNPSEYNGMKLFGSAGRVVPGDVGERVLAAYHKPEVAWAGHTQVGGLQIHEDAHAEHLRRVLGIVDVEKIRAKQFSVLIDSNHGAGGLLGTRLLDALGCDVIALGREPTGEFAHSPEPTAANLEEVSKQVAGNAAVGFCQDPDADRLALIDEAGNYIGEEYTVAICMDHILRNSPGAVVTNCSTSRMSQDLAEKYNVPFFCSKVGEANVADVMIRNGAVFGGEGNGGPIDPRIGYVRDSFVGMALVLNAMADRGMTLSELAVEIPRYEIYKTKVTMPTDSVAGALDRLESHYADAESNRMDGLRLDFPGKWLLVRASNTEPIVRLIAEASTMEVAKKMCDEAAKVM